MVSKSKQSTKKQLLQCMLATFVILQTALPAMAAETTSLDNRPGPRGIALKDDTPKGPYVLTLDDLRDVGLCLSQIKYQSIFVYLEATRKDLNIDTPPAMASPDAISVVPVNSGDKFLPCRRDWLVFFIGTMEPVIHLMDHDVKEFQKGEYQLEIPQADKQQVNLLWQQWASGVTDLNTALDRTNDLLNDDINNNKAIAEQAISIYHTEKKLEEIRETVQHLVQDSLKK